MKMKVKRKITDMNTGESVEEMIDFEFPEKKEPEEDGNTVNKRKKSKKSKD